MVLMIPPLTADYAPGKKEDFEVLVQSILEGNIGSNIKSVIFPDLINLIEPMLSNFEWARSEAMKNYQILDQAYTAMLMKGEVSYRILNLYGSIMNSNFLFSLRVMSTVLPGLMLVLRLTPSPELDLKQDTLTQLKSDLTGIVMISTADMPDSTSIPENSNQYSSILASLVFGYNISLFMGLVFIVGYLAEHEISLNRTQVIQLELLLRDWSQEAVAQARTYISSLGRAR